ncbi:hypoxanthine phosphoribosyltransferase [Planctomicrobium sp. SH661]|uniref:hypoxanthine phosphoribosyltransferase n=1 Tax=Planctomicrobium sp. SH661 TaxID=3448124 RepID=UPI003F5AF9A0
MTSIRTLVSQSQIETAVAGLGEKITKDFQDRNLTILGVLTGSIVLVTDLMRKIDFPHELGLVQASSYRGTATSPGELRINLDFLPDISGRDVLLVDDIFDTGRTLTGIAERLQKLNPRSIQSAVLLWKKVRTAVQGAPDYYCFEIPDEFVVGYGLDFNNQYRHLPYIGVIEES